MLPVIWKDNYMSLLPGERQTVTATYKIRNRGALPASLRVQAWNSPAVVIPLTANKKHGM